MWTTRLLILGLVRWLQPVHGYDVLRELMSWSVDDWAKIKPGSVYHALKKLTADGCLEVAATEQVDNRPARTSYRITAKGESEFQEVLRDKLWNVEHVIDPFFVAWSFMPVLGGREAAAMLRNRAGLLRDQAAKVRETVERNPSDDPRAKNYLPEHVRESLRLSTEITDLTVAWCERVAERAERGEMGVDEASAYDPELMGHWREHIQSLPGPDVEDGDGD